VTPAQASGQPNFVTDWPVQGPTDPGIRAGDCWFAQNQLPAKPACVDCDGPVPAWARTTGLAGGQAMETISFGGVGVAGFAVGGAGDPDVFDGLDAAQQIWVRDALVKLNDYVTSTSKTSCPTWTDPRLNPLSGAVGCFQSWFNANFSKAASQTLRADGVLDEDTLCALATVTGVYHAPDFTTPFPDPLGKHCQVKPAPATAVEKKGLSTGAVVGIGAAGVAVVGGLVYAATRGGGRRRRRR
jgi:hypothetical protein